MGKVTELIRFNLNGARVTARSAPMTTMFRLLITMVPIRVIIFVVVALLAAGPQLIGHNGLNYVLKYLPASTVTTITLLEPLGASALAWALLNEFPSTWDLIGGSFVMVGILVAVTPKPQTTTLLNSS